MKAKLIFLDDHRMVVVDEERINISSCGAFRYIENEVIAASFEDNHHAAIPTTSYEQVVGMIEEAKARAAALKYSPIIPTEGGR